jgi:hypothetical protein
MLIAKIENDQIVVKDHKILFPDTSFAEFGPQQDFLQEHNCMSVRVWKEHDPSNEKLVSAEPYIENGEVYIITVEPLSEQELAGKNNFLASQLRNRRNTLLKESDWTQGRDIADSVAEEWAAYRLALRTLPEQPGFPTEVTWPAAPGSEQ